MRTSLSNRLKLGYLALAATDTWLASRPGPRAHRARMITKPLLMPTLAASLATNPRAASSPMRTHTLVAQGFGWAGDLALLRSGSTAFVTGASSFGVGQLTYIDAFRRHRGDRVGIRAATMLALGAATAPLMGLAAARQDPRLQGPVTAYAGLLGGMGAAAQHLDPRLPRAARGLIGTGAALFLLSDGLLGLRKFVIANPPPLLEGGVMATYTAAQFLISEGVSRAGR